MGKNKYSEIIALALGVFGISVLIVTFLPIFSYQIESKQKFPNLLSPISREGGVLSIYNQDYSRASTWFPAGAASEEFGERGETFYTISISKLGIADAYVYVGGEDLAESLIQYPGTALPGETGNAVIFGHSVLPIFFNPEDYLSIFSTLPKLREGNDIVVNFGGKVFRYVVEDKFEVMPENLEILEQNSTDSYLTLVTCVPPGDPRKPKRLIIRAKLAPSEIAYENTGN